MSDAQSSVIHIAPSTTGSLRVDSDLDYPDFQELDATIRAANGELAHVSTHRQVWAWPYEIYLAVQPLVDTALAAAGAGTGLAALLIELARKRPDRPIHVHIDNNITVVLDGKRELSEEEKAAIDLLAERYDRDPNDPDWHPLGAGE